LRDLDPAAEPGDLRPQPAGFLLQGKHLADPGQVEPGPRQRDDLVKPLDIARAVPSGAAPAAPGFQQAFTLVDAERLRVQASDLTSQDAKQLSRA
jgi:hypothetical protein